MFGGKGKYEMNEPGAEPEFFEELAHDKNLCGKKEFNKRTVVKILFSSKNSHWSEYNDCTKKQEEGYSNSLLLYLVIIIKKL